MSSHDRAGRGAGNIMTILAWVAFLGVGTFAANSYFDQRANPNQSPVSGRNEDGQTELVLKRNWQGHYVATGSINGFTVNFLLDTGATNIALSETLADEIGLQRLRPQRSMTAAGVITSHATRVAEVRLGDIVAYDLQASILPKGMNDHVLLGMAFLKHLEFTQRNDTLILRTMH